jgi:glycosyltransferase involved in cell wall biosynthesis
MLRRNVPFQSPRVTATAVVGSPLHAPYTPPKWDRPDSELGRTLTLRAHYDALTGYGALATGFLRELLKRRVSCQGVPMVAPWEPEWGEAAKIDPDVKALLFDSNGKQRRRNEEGWEVLMASPHHEQEVSPSVIISMWESNRLPDSTVAKLNQHQAIIVPSEWSQLSWDAAGVSRPIYKVNLPISDVFRAYRPIPGGPFTFGLCCRRAHGGLRKGVVQACECFLKAFPKTKDVRLRLKFYPDCTTNDIPKDPRIEVIKAAYTEDQIADFLASLHCYVSTSQAEGYGLVQCQAMGVGRPVIGARAHAQAEYLTDSNAWLLDYDLRDALEVNPVNGYYTGMVFVPKDESVIQRMRQAFQYPDANRMKGCEASERASKMTWEKFIRQVLDVLKKEGLPDVAH